jgi:hypothetical protein
MAYVLVHEEDWTDYGTDIEAVETAYPSWDGSTTNLSALGTTVGPTVGPDGGPGVSDLAGDHSFIIKNVAVPCRSGKVEVSYDFDGWSPSGGQQSGQLVAGWHGHPYSPSMSEYSDMLFQAAHHVSGNLTVFGNGWNSGTLTGVVPTSGTVDFRFEWQISTITGSPGSFSAASDGYFKVYIDNVLEYDTGAIQFWHDDPNIPSVNAGGNFSPYFNIVQLGLHGKVGTWRVYGGDDCGVTNLPPTVDAGPDQTITLPTDTVNLDGTVTDDGYPDPPATVTQTWTKQSGPGTVTFGNAALVDTTAEFSAAGVYVLRLTASDSDLSAYDEMTVTVLDDGIIGSFVAGVKTTVTATRAAAFGLDNNTNVHDEAGWFKIFGNLEVTGETRLTTTTISNKAEIIESIVTASGEIVVDSDGNVVFS